MRLTQLTRSFTRSPFVFALLLGTFSLSSCEKMVRDMAAQQSTQEAAEADSSAAVAAAPAAPKEPLFEITYPQNSPYRDLTPPAGETPNPFEKVPAIAEDYQESPNWADKHVDINGFLLQNQKKDYYFVLQQQAANEMLRHELFQHYYQEPDNANVLKTIGFYTDQLVEAKSDDAELIYKSLRALRDHWPQGKIAQVALSTAARVQARPLASSADTTTRNGSYRQIYARELTKMANRLKGEG